MQIFSCYKELILLYIQLSPVQSLSHVWLFATPWTAACQATLCITKSPTPHMMPCLLLPGEESGHGLAPWTAARQAFLSFTISRSLLKLMPIEWMMPSNHLILCRPLLLLPSVFPSIRVFSNELALRIRWPKYCSFHSESVLPMNIQGWFSWGLTDWISLQSKGLSRVFPSTTVWKHQVFSAQPSLWSNSHICTWLLEKP